MPKISMLYPYSLQSYWTPKFVKIILFAIFAEKQALPCVTKIILTEKLFGVGSSTFGFIAALSNTAALSHIIIEQHTNKY